MNTENTTQDEIQLDTNEQIQQRRSKLETLRKQEGQAFPNDFRRDGLAAQIHALYEDKTHDELETETKRFSVAGRIMMRRLMGKASFIKIQDMSGSLQIYCRKNDLPEGVFEEYKKWDLGDIVGAEGTLFKTKTDELTLRADKLQLLTKALRPLPDKYHGLTDLESRYRQRYLDLIANQETRNTFIIRTQVINGIRDYLTERQYLEVETPMMQVLPGGAAARPFVTHHNTLDMDLYLRIAPELYLKRLVVGGFERVFEINRNFRNEGLSTQHNPEFTMLEFYQAYADYRELMDLTEDLFRTLAKNILHKTILSFRERKIDLEKPFARLTVKQAILKYNPDIKETELDDREQTAQIARKLDIPVRESYGLEKIQIEIFEKTAEDRLMQPTFITAYPAEVSPLARLNNDDPFITDRFEFFIAGREIANGFSELNDPEDQAERFRKQVDDKDAGDLEAMHYDEDYITALEHGLPPTAGEGIGIDRLVMLLTDSPSIRDVLFFPHMRRLM